MKKYYDVHCHIFNKDVVNDRIISVIQPLLTLLNEKKKGTLLNKEKIKNVLERIHMFLEAFTKGSSEDVFNLLDKTYNNELYIVPLMFDLTFADDNDGGRIQNLLYKERREMFIDVVKEAVKFIKLKVKDLPDDVKKEMDKLTDNENGFFNGIYALKEDTFDEENYSNQIEELENLAGKNNRVLPFFGVDVRRSYYKNTNMVEKIREKVLKPNAKFQGIKLYAPAGFSPTDPVLYGTKDDKSGVYKFCEDHDIPVTVHCSNAGFATLSDRLRVRGHVNIDNTLKYYDDFTVIKFKNKFFTIHVADAIKERAETLNHPKIWAEVLKRFPNLTLNLAHFGGSGEIMRFLNYELPDKIKKSDYKDEIEKLSTDIKKLFNKAYDNKVRIYKYKKNLDTKERGKLWNALYFSGIMDNWAKAIYEIIKNPDYPNVYTDLSCYTEGEELKNFFSIKSELSEFKNLFYDQVPGDIRKKLLYGSDFFFCLIFGPDMKTYYNEFKEVFGDEFDTIASVNPEKFLKIS